MIAAPRENVSALGEKAYILHRSSTSSPPLIARPLLIYTSLFFIMCSPPSWTGPRPLLGRAYRFMALVTYCSL